MKSEFRNKITSCRKNMDSKFIISSSSIITDKILSLDVIKKAQTIMLYLDFNNEVKTNELITKLISLNKTVCSPVTIVKNRKLIPCKISNLNNDINIGAYGIREPILTDSSIIDISDIDVVIVPAVAFDKNCYRLGYGGGYYDRFLETIRKDAITLGIAFDFQIFDNIPKEDYDAKLDYIITENKIIHSDK